MRDTAALLYSVFKVRIGMAIMLCALAGIAITPGTAPGGWQIALLALAGWRDAHGGPSGKVAALWTAGVVLFSGSLYWLAVGGPKLLGPVTPLGGAALLAGWALLAWSAFKRPE